MKKCQIFQFCQKQLIHCNILRKSIFPPPNKSSHPHKKCSFLFRTDLLKRNFFYDFQMIPAALTNLLVIMADVFKIDGFVIEMMIVVMVVTKQNVHQKCAIRLNNFNVLKSIALHQNGVAMVRWIALMDPMKR